ncbi:hypothetical protein DNTS_032947 [Danionella cerebrum]|uniref:Uncharacterized protein n=1 Tax=Danionella cerebrum TaxID=2873325 RepID=A0A553Q2D2_9TELE|nr:hypothetical protein DNTS_032947 [Danionella translucida]
MSQEGSTERTEVLSEDRSGASVSDTSDYGDIPEAFICSSSDYDGDVPEVTAGSQTSGYCDENHDGISEGSVASDVPGPSLVSSNKTTEDICEPLVPPPFDDGDGEHGIQQASEHKIEVSQAQVCQREDTEDSSLHLTPKDCGAHWNVISKAFRRRFNQLLEFFSPFFCRNVDTVDEVEDFVQELPPVVKTQPLSKTGQSDLQRSTNESAISELMEEEMLDEEAVILVEPASPAFMMPLRPEPSELPACDPCLLPDHLEKPLESGIASDLLNPVAEEVTLPDHPPQRDTPKLLTPPPSPSAAAAAAVVDQPHSSPVTPQSPGSSHFTPCLGVQVFEDEVYEDPEIRKKIFNLPVSNHAEKMEAWDMTWKSWKSQTRLQENCRFREHTPVVEAQQLSKTWKIGKLKSTNKHRMGLKMFKWSNRRVKNRRNRVCPKNCVTTQHKLIDPVAEEEVALPDRPLQGDSTKPLTPLPSPSAPEAVNGPFSRPVTPQSSGSLQAAPCLGLQVIEDKISPELFEKTNILLCKAAKSTEVLSAGKEVDVCEMGDSELIASSAESKKKKKKKETEVFCPSSEGELEDETDHIEVKEALKSKPNKALSLFLWLRKNFRKVKVTKRSGEKKSC